MSVEPFTIYDTSTGQILRVGSGPTGTHAGRAGAGEAVMSGVKADYATQYVDPGTGALAAKSAGIATADKTTVAGDGVEVLTISDVPDPCMVEVRGPGPAYVAENAGNTVELTFAEAGAFVVRITAPAVLPQEFEVEAT